MITTNITNLNLNNHDDLRDEWNTPTNSAAECSYISASDLPKLLPLNYDTGITLMHVNCRSLPKNFNSLQILVQYLDRPITAIALTETWLKEYMTDLYDLPDYNLVCNSRAKKAGGGVGLYINKNLEFKVRHDLSFMSADLESIFVEISQTKKNLIVGSIYRPPNTDLSKFNNTFITILDKLEKESKKSSFITGDFNLDLIKHDSHQPTSDFLNTILSYSFFPTITKPTRVTQFTSSLIDNIFTNTTDKDHRAGILLSDLSDHYPIILHIPCKLIYKPPQYVHKNRDYSILNMNKFSDELALVNWDLIFSSGATNPNTCYNSFFKIYSELYNRNFPLKTFKRHRLAPRHPWITKGLMRSCAKKEKLYKIYLKDKSDRNKDVYKSYRNKLKSLIEKAEKDYYKLAFQAKMGDIKGTWNLLNSIVMKRPINQDINNLSVEGLLITDKMIIANHLNVYFTNLGSTLASLIPTSNSSFSDYLQGNSANSFSLFDTSAAEVLNIVRSLKNKFSEGYDGISCKVFKYSIIHIADVLSKLINLSISSGIFPDALKIAKICPILKSGDRLDCKNYRPISILPCMSKVYEKILFNRLTSYLDKNKLIIDNQYGFRRGHSTYMPLLDLCSDISAAIDNNEFAIGVFLDLSKAFDTVNHEILVKKLHHYGVRGLPLELFIDYLKNRRQFVSIGDFKSSLNVIKCGVPQGSNLGPLLFLIYINDIISCSSLLKFLLFADDTSIICCNKDISVLVNTINDELTKLASWFCANKLSLNISKSSYIIFGRKSIPNSTLLDISINTTPLSRVKNIKFLGVVVDEHLNWGDHIKYISLKIARGVGVIGKCRNTLPKSVLLNLYYSLVYSYINYCCIIWGNASAAVLKPLQVLQNKAARHILLKPNRTTTSPLFKQLKLLKIQDLASFQTILFVKQYIAKALPCSMMSYLNYCPSKKIITRCNDIFHIPRSRTLLHQKSIVVRGPLCWNSLSPELRNIASYPVFKRMLKESLLRLY